MSNWPHWSLAYYASEWVIRLVMLVVVTRRRRPTSAMAWLVVIFFFPWVGLLLYLLIGRYHLPRRRTQRHARLLEEFRAVGRWFQDHPSIVHPQMGAEQTAAVSLAERLGHMPILGGNAVHLMTRNQDVVDRLVADIDAAEHHVHLLFYIYAADETGQRVSDALARAVSRGVACRVLADAVGSRAMLRRMAAGMAAQGIGVRASLPVGLFRRQMARVDLRNHRKLAIIDGRIGYTGSQNIIQAGAGQGKLVWRDLMVRLTGPIVLELQTVFLCDWYFDTAETLDGADILPEPDLAGTIAVQTLPSGPNFPTENHQRMVVAALHSAQQRVTITTPYFVPDEVFMEAMEVAVLRGVEVELIVPRTSNYVLVDAASRSYYDELLRSGVKLYLYTGGLLHAKAITFDNKIAFIGSSNFDIRSFALNFEMNLLFYGPEVAEALRAAQNEYIRQSVPLTLQEWRSRSKVRAVFQNIARLLSPLL